MQQTIDLLKGFEWFLKPISGIFQFLFTTVFGIIILSILFILYLFIYTADTIWIRRLMYSGKRLPSGEGIYVFFKGIFGAVANFVTKLPLLIGIFLIMALISGLYSSMHQLDQFVENQKKIKELKSVVRQIDQSIKIAEVKVSEQIFSEAQNSTSTTLEIKYYDDLETGQKPQTQSITIKGSDIYFDAYVINFEYSEIIESNVKNIAIPYRIFSDELPQSNGVILNVRDKNGIPYYFKRKKDQIYGMTEGDFNKRVSDLIQLSKDENLAREMGIRSSYGNAVHFRMFKGNVFQIWVEQSGGLVLKNMSVF